MVKHLDFMLHSDSDKGFRFCLNIKESEAFAEYLDHVDQYMFEHGEEI